MKKTILLVLCKLENMTTKNKKQTNEEKWSILF
jgi:hypothetical protein